MPRSHIFQRESYDFRTSYLTPAELLQLKTNRACGYFFPGEKKLRELNISDREPLEAVLKRIGNESHQQIKIVLERGLIIWPLNYSKKFDFDTIHTVPGDVIIYQVIEYPPSTLP